MQEEVGGAGRPDLAQAREECQPGSGEIRLPLFWRSRPWDSVDVASRRTLEDLIEARCHPLGVVAVVVAVATVVLTRGFFFRLPLCLALARRASNDWRSRFFFFFSFFSESFANFCFSVD